MPRTGGELRFNTLKQAQASNVMWLIDMDQLLDSILSLRLKPAAIDGFWITKVNKSNLKDSSRSLKIIGADTLSESSNTLEGDHNQLNIQDILYQHPYLYKPTESLDPIALAITQAIKDKQGANRGFTQAITNLSL